MVACLKKKLKAKKISKKARIQQAEKKCIAAKRKHQKITRAKALKKSQRLKLKQQKAAIKQQTVINYHANNQDLGMS